MDLWSEDLSDTSWGEGWAPFEESPQDDPPQIWPEPEVCAGMDAIFTCMTLGVPSSMGMD